MALVLVVGVTPMLSVRFGPDVPPAMSELVAFHGRACGLSLAALEEIGACLDSVEAFLVAAEEGRALDHARALGLAPPPRVREAPRVPGRLLGSA